jgi:hypothetical protein
LIKGVVYDRYLIHAIRILEEINATGEITSEDADYILAVALAINLEYLKKGSQACDSQGRSSCKRG